MSGEGIYKCIKIWYISIKLLKVYKNTTNMIPLLKPGDAKGLRTHESASQLSARAKKRLEWILYYTENTYSVSETCRKFGISRSTFYRVLDRFDSENIFSLEDKVRSEESEQRSSIPSVVIQRIRACREQDPMMSRERIAAVIVSECNCNLSPSTIGRIIRREGFYFGESLSHHRKRCAREEQLPPVAGSSLPAPQVATEPSEGFLKS